MKRRTPQRPWLIACLVLLATAVWADEPGKAASKKGKSAVQAAEKALPTSTSTPNPDLSPPKVKPVKVEEAEYLPSLKPVVLPDVQFPERIEPTPTPVPGLIPRDPTAAALMSAVVPGLGHAYCGEPVRGLFFSAAFGISLYLTLKNLRLETETGSDQRVAHNETAGSLYGLATLAAYGFGIQDAANSARRYNRKNHLNAYLALRPHPCVQLAFSF